MNNETRDSGEQICPYKNDSFETNDTNVKVCPYRPDDEVDEYSPSGCPVINKIQKELDTNFEFYYELPYYSQNDFYFEVQGELETKDFIEKTKLLRAMPRHLKNTLFHLKDEKIKKIREKEFTIVYFVYEEIREKANKLYRDKNYTQALSYFNYAYSCFKWLEFKSEERNKEGIIESAKLLPILDDDIIDKRIITDQNFTFEEASFKGCMVSILKSMSFAYIHLRNFSEALNCLNEALVYADEKVPELYLRRSQARTYNKNSDIEQLKLALCDIHRAKQMKPDEIRFDDHLKILNILIEETQAKFNDRIYKIFSNAKYSLNKIKEKNLNLEEHVYSSYQEIIHEWNILEEMWKKYNQTLKFHTDKKNDKQIKLAKQEIDNFKDVYMKFKFYYCLDINKLPSWIIVNEEDR